MSLKGKIVYWCFGGWIVDAIAGWIKTENSKIDGHSGNETGSWMDYKCTGSAFCEDMQSHDGELYCMRGRYGKPECKHASAV